jgi:DHA3 family macrolide efflux protein-like MFS transporter
MAPRPRWLNFTLLCLGQLVSQFGDSIFHIGLVWLALELTGSKSLSGIIVAAGFLPAILFSLAAGVVADRVDRRRLMILCAAIQALVVSSVPFLNRFDLLSAPVLAIVAFSLAAGAAFFNPARDALVPHLVAENHLTRANSFVQGSAQVAFLAGPLAAGLLTSWAGTIHLFTIDAGTFVASAVFLLLIRTSRATSPRMEFGPVPPPQTPTVAGRTWQDIVEGLRYAFEDPRLRGLLFVTAAENLIIMGPAILGTPVYVREILGFGQGGVAEYSYLIGVLFAGMITASLVIGLKGRSWPKGKLILVGIILDGATFIPFFFIRTFPAACLAMFVHGLTVPMIILPRTTLIQEIVPDDRRGRIFALVNMAVVGFTALSMVLCGVVSERIGMDEIYLGAGILGAACGILGMLFASLWKA